MPALPWTRQQSRHTLLNHFLDPWDLITDVSVEKSLNITTTISFSIDCYWQERKNKLRCEFNAVYIRAKIVH